jgi:predicted Holliday junction resolvase-like endonuclease
MNWMLVLALLGLTTTIVVHLLAFVWVMSSMKTSIDKMDQRLLKMEEREQTYVKRGDYDAQVTKRDSELSDVWRAHNELRTRFEDCRARESKKEEKR